MFTNNISFCSTCHVDQCNERTSHKIPWGRRTSWCPPNDGTSNGCRYCQLWMLTPSYFRQGVQIMSEWKIRWGLDSWLAWSWPLQWWWELSKALSAIPSKNAVVTVTIHRITSLKKHSPRNEQQSFLVMSLPHLTVHKGIPLKLTETAVEPIPMRDHDHSGIPTPIFNAISIVSPK